MPIRSLIPLTASAAIFALLAFVMVRPDLPDVPDRPGVTSVQSGRRASAVRSSRPLFIATIHPVAAIVREITGAEANVACLLPPGVSPHGFEARPSDARLTAGSAGLFYVDPSLDGWAASMPGAVPVSLLALVPDANLMAPYDPHDPIDPDREGASGAEFEDDLEDGHEQGHEHGREQGHEQGHEHGDSIWDSHFWLDPVAVEALARPLAQRLAELDPEHGDAYRRNAERFAADLAMLEDRSRRTLAPHAGDSVVLFHPSFRYLLRRYGLEQAGVVEGYAGREPTPREFGRLIDRIRDGRARAILTEPQMPTRLADALAEATGVGIAQLDPIGGVAGRATYADLISYNVDALAVALRGGGQER